MTSRDTWDSVDAYLTELLGHSDEELETALARSREAGLPAIEVSPEQGALLGILARALGARRVLEIGTLGGYSSTLLARGLLPGGRLLTLELDPEHAEVARSNLAAAGLTDRVDVLEGPALDTLVRLRAGFDEPFDLVFIDAEKADYPDYLAAVIPLCRPGTLILADNVVRKGAVVDASDSDPRVVGARRFLENVARDPRLRGTVLQTVGRKGHDGMAVVVVLDPERDHE
jgi:predicted O-methyltransferase YrrM